MKPAIGLLSIPRWYKNIFSITLSIITFTVIIYYLSIYLSTYPSFFFQHYISSEISTLSTLSIYQRNDTTTKITECVKKLNVRVLAVPWHTLRPPLWHDASKGVGDAEGPDHSHPCHSVAVYPPRPHAAPRVVRGSPGRRRREQCHRVH